MKNKKNRGISLVEVLLYIAISTIVMTSLSYFMFIVLRSRVKSQTVTEVEYQGNRLTYLITETIKNSKAITTPAIASSSQNLIINTGETGTNPTEFYLADGKVFIRESSSTPVQISSERIKVIEMKFENISITADTSLIKVTLSITHRNPENKMEYNFSEVFSSSAATRDDYL